MKKNGKLMWIPQDILEEISMVKMETGVKYNPDALRIIVKRSRKW